MSPSFLLVLEPSPWQVCGGTVCPALALTTSPSPCNTSNEILSFTHQTMESLSSLPKLGLSLSCYIHLKSDLRNPKFLCHPSWNSGIKQEVKPH